MTEPGDLERDFSLIVISLLKGVTYAEDDPALWHKLMSRQSSVRDYVRTLGLELVIHEDEGYAWLKNAPWAVESGLPVLAARRQLSYPVSLLLALLRRRLTEHDASSGDRRLIVSRDEIVEMMRTFLPPGSNEARIVDQIDAHLNKAIELGFIRRLKTENNKIEIRRILKAFIDAQWLHEFDRKLKEYVQRNLGNSEAGDEE
ncbi:MAG: DUF4194 domain-containing protein [Spirochaetes bacterium]|nr:MAG: DUF4194 domain-containing protein [Spirochaetota bacterium]